MIISLHQLSRRWVSFETFLLTFNGVLQDDFYVYLSPNFISYKFFSS